MNKRRVSARVLLTLVSGVILGGLAAEAAANSDAILDEEKTSPQIETLTDFTDPVSNQRWRVRNDDVMGGRSIGQMTIDNDTNDKAQVTGILKMYGSINTDGGGFTSVLMDVSPSADAGGAGLDSVPDFRGVRGIRMRVRASGEPVHRPYRLRVEDTVRRGRPINFRGLLPLSVAVEPDEWQTVTVWLEGLRPTLRGEEMDPADWKPLDVARIDRLGIVLNDTDDGPYRLEIDRIQLVR